MPHYQVHPEVGQDGVVEVMGGKEGHYLSGGKH